jgi:hypothetical protein
MTKKFIAIVAILMFLATSITVASAKNEYTVVSKSGGKAVTEYFNLCRIESSGHGFGMSLGSNHNNNYFWWGIIYYNNGTTTIKTPQKTLTVKGCYDLQICKLHPIMKYLFNLSQPYISFVGKHNLPPVWEDFVDISLKGIARGVAVTYYQ